MNTLLDILVWNGENFMLTFGGGIAFTIIAWVLVAIFSNDRSDDNKR